MAFPGHAGRCWSQLRSGTMTDLRAGERYADLRSLIDAWASRLLEGQSDVAAIDRRTADDTTFGEPRWYIRMCGDEKDFTTVWLTLAQRTLRYETYVMPAPEENEQRVADFLLR